MDTLHISIKLVKYLIYSLKDLTVSERWTEMTTIRPNGWFIDLLCLPQKYNICQEELEEIFISSDFGSIICNILCHQLNFNDISTFDFAIYRQ